MGTPLKYRPSAFEESLSIIQRLLRGEAVSSSGRFVFRDARVALRPAENVECWVGASAPPAIDRAARLAEGWLASPALTLEEAGDQATFYLERCRAYGRAPTAVAIRRRSEEHTSELQSRPHLVCRLLLEKKKFRSSF